MNRYEAPVLAEAREAAAEIERYEQLAREWRARRDELMREARAAGIMPTEIGSAVGMVRTAVYKILEKGPGREHPHHDGEQGLPSSTTGSSRPGVARVSTDGEDQKMTRKEWRDTVLRDDWDTISDAERAARIEAAMNPDPDPRAATGP